MANLKNEENVLEAGTVFLLMKKGFPISRNVRAQWILEHLDSVISIQDPNVDNAELPDLEIVSALPENKPEFWSIDASHQFLYKVVPTTKIIFLAYKYRIVFSLDFSPSLATIDIQHGEIVIDEVSLAVKRFLEGVTKPFTIPGSRRIMQPEIYVTMIAHTPFFTNPAQQVLVQGWLATEHNVNCLIEYIEKQLNMLEERVASVTAIANQQLEMLRTESERLVGRLFEEGGAVHNKNNSNSMTNTSMVSPEASFINMLRYGMLALTLLPQHSCAHLVVITDGIVGTTDIHALDSVIQQLRAATVACSFLRVGSSYHPHCADGLIPYQDLLLFLAKATLGNYMTFTLQPIPVYGTDMNIYHKNYLCWQLYRDESYDITSDYCNKWHSKNSLFYGHKSTPLLRKKQTDDKVICTLSSLLCCRLREGYLIKRATVRDDILEICFVLLWKTNVLLEYLITCSWVTKSLSVSNTIQYTITIEAPYEFLHDITCLSKKPLKSQYRRGVVSRFWTALTSLTESDNMLAHFSWFPGSGWTWYSVPDTIRSGMPVFYLSAYPSASTVQLSDAACPQFGQIWQPVVSLDPTQWGRWMHTQRITLILSHDRPLPRHLHQANQSGRFQCVQCRQAAAVLYAMLKNWATFVLVENHTYVQFIYREAEKPPVSFSLIRINCKALCVVLNIAFAGGTEGVVRHNVVVDLIERLSKLTLPNRPTEQKETPCCTIIHKSLERILIRYERMPTDLSVVIFPDGTQPTATRNTSVVGGSLMTTLSRYLYHNRWLCHIKRPLVQTIPGVTLPRLNITAIGRVLSTITKMRLVEGFNFAYSAAGIINMVLEVQMQGFGNDETVYPCIIQYILFPPHFISNTMLERDSGSDEDTDEGTVDGEVSTEDCENTGDFQMVTEVWIEPQCGYVQIPAHRTARFMHTLQYYQLPDAIAEVDGGCINALLTLEHLSLLCQVTPLEKSSDIVFGQAYQGVKFPEGSNARDRYSGYPSTTELFERSPITDERIHNTHFSFDTLSILPKCQQAELLFSMFANGTMYDAEGRNSANKILMEGFLERIKHLHNKELLLTSAESHRFTEMLLERPREDGPPLPLFLQREPSHENNDLNSFARWRCFVKGISATHIIVTILPASEKDVELLIHPSRDDNLSDNSVKICESDVFLDNKVVSPTADKERIGTGYPPVKHRDSKVSSNSSTAHSTPIQNTHPNLSTTESEAGFIIPVYAYDCSLALLIDALVDKLQSPRAKDIYQDHTFRIGQQDSEDFVTLKTGSNTKPSSPEPKSEDSDNIANDQRSLMDHCKLLNLAHCHCYVFAVYKSLALQQALSYEDMEAAVEQCEETFIEINITNYLKTVCKHFSNLPEDELQNQLRTSACGDVKPLHDLIKDKFERIITVAFRPVPAHPEFYYCSPSWISERTDLTDSQKSDNEDELKDFTFHSEIIDSKIDHSSDKVNQLTDATWPCTNTRRMRKLSSCDSMESLICDLQEEGLRTKEQPLFLQLSCSIRYRSELCSIPVKLLPTCITEILVKMDDYRHRYISDLNSADLKITLDIICLNLSKEVLEITLERYPSLKTSYSSTSPVDSLHTESDSSPCHDTRAESLQDKMQHLPLYQHNAIANLTEEIEWLLQDETATALLDQSLPSEDTLKFVAQHVAESTERSSCTMEKVPLHFVFNSDRSGPKFLDELTKLEIDRYSIRQEGNLFYFVKSEQQIADEVNKCMIVKPEEMVTAVEYESGKNNEHAETHNDVNHASRQNSGDAPGCYSEISSIGEGKTGTDDGYEGDSSNSEDDYQWLVELDKRRTLLPNFWLILKVESTHVDVYFHCRFLNLACSEVERYSEVQKMVVIQLKAICRRVNQYLLLQNLHDTRICDCLLEPESNEDRTWRGGDICSDASSAAQNYNSVINPIPGMFRCPVIWEVQFWLHPRLKTGPGRSGLSRGIKALHGVLNRFSVNNRNNMFVYQENNENVFYLRLHEQTYDGKLQSKLSESDEKLVVSRSNSVASLAQAKSMSVTNEHISANDTRPRVRSFGEKESDVLNKTGDSIILMVHGISEAGPEIKHELVQVLQNRLDDAVLEVLSVMLARNPMCKLTPADVHFIQKEYRAPECIIQLSVQPHCLPHIGALGYYLRQNVLQFLYIPKYTDNRAHYHFQDYSQPESSSKRVPESDIFLYNQSHSSGSKGIACIALAITNSKGELIDAFIDETLCKYDFPKSLKSADFEKIVSAFVYDSKSVAQNSPEILIEFRIWKQGRVNLESLRQKLCAAVKHGTWDLITEYNLLSAPLTKPLTAIDIDAELKTPIQKQDNQTPMKTKSTIPCTVLGNLTIDQYEFGEEGKLCEIYHVTLAKWFQFALEMGVPSVKKHDVIIEHRHAISVIVTELQTFIRSQVTDMSCRAFVLLDRQPFIRDCVSQRSSNIKQSKNIDDRLPIYIPCDFSKDEQGTYTKCILIARNFYQWKASSSTIVEPELLVPKDQKVLQKFNPLILENTFVPRQRILLAEIQSNHISLYMYNWSKEKSEKLMKQTTNLGSWLSCRSNLYTNILMQKLGIFHHQPIQSFQQREQSSSQYCPITDMESLTKFLSHGDGKEWTRSSARMQSVKNNPFSWNQLVGQAMRDAKPNTHHHYNTTDPVVKAAYELQDLRHRDKKTKEDLNGLYAMWQTRSTAPNIPISHSTLNTFKQHSRLIHFCHTPLLFLPKWRLQSAATRDHSLTPPSSIVSNSIPHQQLMQQIHIQIKEEPASVVKWHDELCDTMLTEYKQYLQTLGFNAVQIESSHKTEEDCNRRKPYYLKKSMLGGVLLFEIHLSEPFFIVKLHVIECNRLQTKTNSAMVNQFVLSFVDACDEIKINMHLHSFIYDFHLRCIHSYIAGNISWSSQQGYHLTHFLDDFNKYYSKAPNYARNLIYSDIITIRNLATPARTLYSYLLSHEKTYEMRVFVMSSDQQESDESEYVLVKLQSTPLIGYCDSQDTRYTDDFDVALIVSRLEQPSHIEKVEITLKYYLILTSKRELYPKREVENNKRGKFRTVHSVVKPTSSSHGDSPSDPSPVSPVSSFGRKASKSETIASSYNNNNNNEGATSEINCMLKEADIKKFNSGTNNIIAPTPPPVPNSPLTQNPNIMNSSYSSPSSHLIQIRRESVNYLGYYSSHEQLMQQMIMSQAQAAQRHITSMIDRGALQCRTHLLWNKLLENRSPMTYTEFMELCSLAHVESLSIVDPRLSAFTSQPISWYQGLAKILQNKYQEHHKQFNTPDGNITHHLILHPSFLQAFMMLTVDLHTSRGDLHAVYCKSAELINTSFTMEDVYDLIEGFVNACCFHLWMGLCSQ